MAWQDSGFLIDEHIDAEGVHYIDVLTKAYGRHRGVINKKGEIDIAKSSSFELRHEGLHGADNSQIQVSKVDSKQLDTNEGSIDLDVVSSVRALSQILIPVGEPVPELYSKTIDIVDSLKARDGRWPIAYARWELALLRTLGLMPDIDRYRQVINDGETVYFSLRTMRAFTRIEAGAFLDKLLPVPAFLLGVRNAVVAEVKQATTLTGGLLAQLVAEKTDAEGLPTARLGVLELIDGITDLPRSSPTRGVIQDDFTVKKRLLSMKPLTVGYAVSSRG